MNAARAAYGFGLLALTAACQSHEPARPYTDVTPPPFRVEVLADELDLPWGLAFLPDGAMLVTEKSGRLLLLEGEARQAVEGVPASTRTGQGGLLDVALHPRYAAGENWVYLSYSRGKGEYATTLGRGRLRRGADGAAALHDWQTLFVLPGATGRGHHFGSRIAFDRQGHLYLSIGDRGERDRAQDPADPAGSILRLHDDGRIPADNPFVGRKDAHPAIWSIGHRNPQGMARRPGSDEIWIHEHGPQGGDEVNIPRPGANYGWPVITYGVEYVTGLSIGEGTRKKGMEQPLHWWVPSIAPSGLAFYQGTPFADWQGDLLIGGLKCQCLVRLDTREGAIVAEYRYQPGGPARIRDVRVGPDGLIYLLTDAGRGQLLRLRPAS